MLVHRTLELDEDDYVRRDAVEALSDLAVFDSDAISALAKGLEHWDERVREGTVAGLERLGGRARGAVPPLRALIEREPEGAPLAAAAASALERVMSDAPVLRYDEPYHSVSRALERGRFFGPGVAENVQDALDGEDFQEALRQLEAGVVGEQDSIFWLDMFTAARELDLPQADRYYECFNAPAEASASVRLEELIRSTCSVRDGMQRVLDYLAQDVPSSEWDRFHDLPVEDDSARLEAWLEGVFLHEAPPADIRGLFFGITDLQRDGRHTLDLSISGERAERDPRDGDPRAPAGAPSSFSRRRTATRRRRRVRQWRLGPDRHARTNGLAFAEE